MQKSPCTNICRMDAENKLCVGCWRTIDEITAWSKADDASRASILAAVAQRRQAAEQHTGAPVGTEAP